MTNLAATSWLSCLWTACAVYGQRVLSMDSVCCLWTACAVYGQRVMSMDNVCLGQMIQTRLHHT